MSSALSPSGPDIDSISMTTSQKERVQAHVLTSVLNSALEYYRKRTVCDIANSKEKWSKLINAALIEYTASADSSTPSHPQQHTYSQHCCELGLTLKLSKCIVETTGS